MLQKKLKKSKFDGLLGGLIAAAIWMWDPGNCLWIREVPGSLIQMAAAMVQSGVGADLPRYRQYQYRVGSTPSGHIRYFNFSFCLVDSAAVTTSASAWHRSKLCCSSSSPSSLFSSTSSQLVFRCCAATWLGSAEQTRKLSAQVSLAHQRKNNSMILFLNKNLRTKLLFCTGFFFFLFPLAEGSVGCLL